MLHYGYKIKLSFLYTPSNVANLLREILVHFFTRRAKPGGRGTCPCPRTPLSFLRSKEKKRKQKKKRYNAEPICRLLPRSKCYCFSHSRASKIQKCFLSANHDGRQYCSMLHGPYNLKFILLVLFFCEMKCIVSSVTIMIWKKVRSKMKKYSSPSPFDQSLIMAKEASFLNSLEFNLVWFSEIQ